MSGDRAAGAATTAAGALALVLQFTAPWVAATAGSGARLLHRSEVLVPGAVGYERLLLVVPLGAAAALVVAGAAMGWGRLPVLQRAGWTVASAGGFALLLNGTRWFGFYIARLADSGPSIVHLHVVPYAHLVLGAGVLALTLPRVATLLRPADRPWLGAGITGLLALLLLPLLPFASATTPSGTFHYDELTMAILSERRGESGAKQLEQARLALWTVVVLAAAGVTAMRTNFGAWTKHLFWVLGLPTAYGAVAAARSWWLIPRMTTHPSPGPNVLPMLAFAILGFWLAWNAVDARRGARNHRYNDS